MNNTSNDTVVCPECRQISAYNDDGKYDYSHKVIPVTTTELREELQQTNKILISEFHKDHYFIIYLKRESEDSSVLLHKQVESTFNIQVQSLAKTVIDKSKAGEKSRVLVLSDQALWRQLINTISAVLLQDDQNLLLNSTLTTSNVGSTLKFENLEISHNLDEINGDKFNVVIVDQKNLIDDHNVHDLLGKLVMKGTFVVTVNSTIEDPIPKIQMKDFSDTLKEFRLNFLFVDIQAIQQATILLTQVLRK